MAPTGFIMFDTPESLHMVVPGAVNGRRPHVLVLFGTRPEAIKLAPVIHELKANHFEVDVVSSSQHIELLRPFLKTLNISVDHDLSVMKRAQSPNQVCSRVMAKLDPLLDELKPDLILVQGDTTTALSGALAGFNRRIPVGHVEAGLRSGDPTSPFPEEMNRRLITQLAALHFAATDQNRRTLISEGVRPESVWVTGNPVVDSLNKVLADLQCSDTIEALLEKTNGTKRILLTTHRRESFGSAMAGNLNVLRDFVDAHGDVSLLFPVHPNPNVREAASQLLGDHERIHLLEPLEYPDFLSLMRSAWLIVSDSGGVQEEAPTLGKPLLIIRENTERPEALSSGVAKLVGNDPSSLRRLLTENYSSDAWTRSVCSTKNPFGDGRAAQKIVRAIESRFAAKPAANAVRSALATAV